MEKTITITESKLKQLLNEAGAYAAELTMSIMHNLKPEQSKPEADKLIIKSVATITECRITQQQESGRSQMQAN